MAVAKEVLKRPQYKGVVDHFPLKSQACCVGCSAG